MEVWTRVHGADARTQPTQASTVSLVTGGGGKSVVTTTHSTSGKGR
jgi:hypothetical protein